MLAAGPASTTPDHAPSEEPHADAGGDNRDRLAWFMRRVEGWLMMRPVPLVAALVHDTHLSLRQVERNCKALYGRSPKTLARRTRALRAATAIRVDPDAGYDIIEYGFYDQAHMIREIKLFTGMTPGQIRSGRRPYSMVEASVCHAVPVLRWQS